MKTETIKFVHHPWFSEDALPEKTAVVEYAERPHWNKTSPGMKAYTVIVDGMDVGYIERSVENTDRQYNRIRIPGKGRLAWQYRGQVSSSSPGLHERNRWAAVAKLIGYSGGTPV